MSRALVTEKIVAAKLAKDLTWASVAQEIGQSKEWVTCGLLRQMAMNEHEAAIAARIFDLSDEEAKWLTVPPYRGALGQDVPTDALLYRFYELIQVYGPAMKALIEELEIACPISGSRDWTDVRQFNLMFSTQLGNISGSESKLYLRPETGDRFALISIFVTVCE